MSVELNPRVMELLVSRICHDLVSPVGAINNGIELMEEMGDEAGDEAVGLIANSVEQASVRLKCFRICYGAAGAQQGISFGDIKQVFLDWLGKGRVQLDWNADTCYQVMPPAGFMKTLLNILLFAEECALGSGAISIEPCVDNKGVRVTLEGPKASFREGAEEALRGEADIDSLDPRLVHGYVTAIFAEHFGLDFSFARESNEQISFTLKFS